VNIVLCGLPKSGKTSIGRMLADQLRWNFIDTDRLIERAYPKGSCREIFLKEGEPFFRRLEKEQIRSLKGSSQSVIALGGGSLNDPENRKTVKAFGDLIYLKVQPEIIWERMRELPAYLSSQKAFYDLAKERMPTYEKAAHFIMETDQCSCQEIVVKILDFLQKPL
jgi:shikimate kinase